MSIGGVFFDWKLVLLVIISTIIPMLDRYNHRFFEEVKAYDRFIYYFIIPCLIIWLIWRDSPRNFGFGLGNWKAGLAWTVGVAVVMGVILWFVARTPAMATMRF